MQYKVSPFNCAIKENNSVLLFNSASGALLDISKERYVAFVSAGKNNTLTEFIRLNPEFEKGRFVLPEKSNELDRITLKFERERFDDKVLSLTLCPTLGCNFRCTYCYQDPAIQKGTMSNKIEERIIEFVTMYLPRVEYVDIQWYGGEPLLQLQRIISITKRIRALCKKAGKGFSASITTNGYLLTGDVGKVLSGVGIRNAQITLDGPPEIHNKRRPLQSGKGTFDTILLNIISNRKNLKISLRVNVDANNAKYLSSLYAILKKHKLESYAYLAPVQDKVSTCVDVADCRTPALMSIKKFANIEAKSFKELGNIKFLKKKLRPRPIYCAAPSVKFIVLDPEGWLYKCWHSIGNPNERIGSIFFKRQIPLADTHVKWLTYSPLRDKKCGFCPVLPLCVGGCPHIRLFQRPNGEPECESIRYNLPNLLRLTARIGVKSSGTEDTPAQ